MVEFLKILIANMAEEDPPHQKGKNKNKTSDVNSDVPAWGVQLNDRLRSEHRCMISKYYWLPGSYGLLLYSIFLYSMDGYWYYALVIQLKWTCQVGRFLSPP